MKYQPTGSLRSYLNIPQLHPQSLLHINVKVVAEAIRQYWDMVESCSTEAYPELDATEFYCLNHLTSIIRANYDQDEQLPDWAKDVVERYAKTLAFQGQRLFSYLLLVTTRESRHLHNQLPAMTGMNPAHLTFHGSIKGGGSQQTAKYLCSNPPNMTIGEYTANLVKIFNKGKWGGGYGGKPWGNIAECARKMIHGETSIEVMVDTGYTLAHNNGPMFNKGMLYHMYSKSDLIRILDVQRAGQIPEMVLNKELTTKYIAPGLRELVTSVKQALPTAFGDFVDWYDVEKKGAKQQYATDKAKQVKKIPSKPKATFFMGKKAVEVGPFAIMPGQNVIQYKRTA